MQKQDIIIRILGLAYCLNFLELAIVATEFKILFIQRNQVTKPKISTRSIEEIGS